MTYFTEVSDYKTYANENADFHFSYNANSGGGQSFLGGMFADENGTITSPTILDGFVGVFKYVFKDPNGQERSIILDDVKGKYEIKPRGIGSTSMKLGVGTKLESPSKLISALFMLPPTCAIKNPNNLDVSILSSNNYWLQSMWLKCVIHNTSKQVELIPIDFVYCGGNSKERQGNDRFFELDAQKRLVDIISLSQNAERLPNDLSQCIDFFSKIYLGKTSFDYNTCIKTTNKIMVLLAKNYPDKYAGIEDPLPFLTSLTNSTNQDKQYKHSIVNNSIPDTFRPLLTAIRTKPFILLAGISGTGKSRIVRKLAQASVSEDLQKMYDPKAVEGGFNRWQLHKPANFELIQVKPNWHNSLEVVGYKSNIGGAHYEFTPFVEFVARAWKHPETPFFLCLDEMNLAPVEQYFAEFLSAIESRSIENGEYETDPIIKPFAEFGEDVCTEMLNHLLGKVDAAHVGTNSPEAQLVQRFRTKGLTLPQNLIILGTVNMDETTFSFSRKVLDRAMSIVMDDVDYNSYFDGQTENNVPEMDEGIKQLIINRHINGLEAKDNDADTVKNYLTAINAILDKTPFKLGYRAANEALLYVSAAHSINAESSTNAALDEFTLMKILSRIEGDKRSIDNLLENLKGVITNADYPKSYEVLDSMSKTLNSKQFVSYWTK